MCSSGMQAANLTVRQQIQLAKTHGRTRFDNHGLRDCNRQIKSKLPDVNSLPFLS